MAELTIERLSEAVAGGAVALRSIMRLQPVDGPGGKVFPPTYAVTAENKYAVEERQVGDRVVTTVLLDSVASQANRAELALLEGWEAGELSFPVPYVDFTDEPDRRGPWPHHRAAGAPQACGRDLPRQLARTRDASSGSAISARRSPRPVRVTPPISSAMRRPRCCSGSGTQPVPRAA